MPKPCLDPLSLFMICLTLLLAMPLTACAPFAATSTELPTGQIIVTKNGKDFAVVQVSSIGTAKVAATFKKKGGATEDPAKLLALVTDAPIVTTTPVFGMEDAPRLADLIIRVTR